MQVLTDGGWWLVVQVEAVRELMAMGADPTITDEQGCTPADVVCQRTSGHKPRDAILDLLRAVRPAITHQA